MTTIEFLLHLRGLGVRLWIDGDRLRYSAPKGTLTPALREELVECKAEILTFLHRFNFPIRSTLPPILPISRDEELPLSFAQQRLWFLDQLEPGNQAYNIPVAFHLTGSLNVAALEQSLNEIVRRHEILRTTFAVVDGRPVQVIAPAMSLTVPIVDLQELSETKRESEVQRLVTEEAQRPFDLTQGPLLRATLLRLSGEEHVLLLTMHHIISDGWSVGVFNRELSMLYEAFSTGKPSPLPELPIQYGDFAHCQRQWLQGEVLEAQLAYWKQQLGGSLPMLELPTDRPRPAVQTFRGARQSFRLPETLSESLKALSRQEDVTLFMTLLAAFKTLLYRYTGQEDILVGSPIANRNRAEIEGLMGFFVNTLVLRTDLSGTPSFRELFGRVREVTLGAYTHQDLPFEKLVEELRPERDPSHNPLFQVVFVLQNVPMEAPPLLGLKVSPLEVDNGTAKFDLTLELWERPEGISGQLEYNTDLFDAPTITRMGGHFQTLLEGIVANPEQRLSDLPILTEAERQQLLVEWSQIGADYPRDKCIHQFFEEQAERTPEALAVVFEEERLSYAELNRRANQLAHFLQKLGVGREVLVGICVERSLEMVVGLLGIFKAGGAYVPLDPTYPKERLAFMLEDTQAPVLLTQERLLGGLPEHKAHVICLDTGWEAIGRESVESPDSGVTADNLAYVIYTSGSTGRPKGVTITHANICPLLHWGYENLGLTTADRSVQYLSYSFDWSVWEIFITLTSGASLFVIPGHQVLDPKGTVDFITENGITVLHGTPTQIQFLTALGQRLETLKYACIGAEALTFDLVERCHGLLDAGCRLFNMYGPTEAAIITTVLEIDRGDISKYKDQGSVSIGRPVSNAKCYILDKHGNLRPIGVPGELHISGDGLARGYLSRPELTAEKFVPAPFDSKERMYKTGDLVRWLPDGNIEFLGRMDHQVKVRGFRIELGEIEAVLEQHPAVRRVLVLAREDRPGAKYLVAYVVPRQGQAPTSGELRSFLKEKLPDYMVPSAFVLLDTLPLTPSGKVDRRALPAPDRARSEVERVFVAPRSTLELQLTRIWEEVLGIELIGVKDNFFELGGHSLLAVRLIDKIQKLTRKNLPLAILFQAPTVEQLADVLHQRGDILRQSPLVALQPRGSRKPFFCVHAIGGEVFGYANLARWLYHRAPDQPVYGIRARGLDPGQKPLARIEDMAEYYISALRGIQSEGPYFLGGWSFGGIIAFEMARQLHAHGERVAFLAIIDTRAPLPDRKPEKEWWYLDDVWAAVYNIKQKGVLLDQLDPDYMEQLKPEERLAYVIEQGRETGKLGLDIDANLWRRIGEIRRTNWKARWKYIPQTYPGRVTLFRSGTQHGKSQEYAQNPQWGWEKLATEGVEVHTLSSTTHRSLIADPQLADKIAACLNRAQIDDQRSYP